MMPAVPDRHRHPPSRGCSTLRPRAWRDHTRLCGRPELPGPHVPPAHDDVVLRADADPQKLWLQGDPATHGVHLARLRCQRCRRRGVRHELPTANAPADGASQPVSGQRPSIDLHEHRFRWLRHVADRHVPALAIQAQEPVQGVAGPPPGSHSPPGPGLAPCVTTASDDACTVCVKGACCSDYQSCLNDAGCLCWVTCKAAGYSDTTCEQPAYCGPLDAVSSSAAACLDANCGAQCGTMIAGSGSGSCACDSSSSSSGATTSCTPGSSGPGETCFSDGDCTSCVCNTQTMTCD